MTPVRWRMGLGMRAVCWECEKKIWKIIVIILRVSLLTLDQSLKHGALCTLRSVSRVKRPLTKLPRTQDTRRALRIRRGARVPATEASKVFVLRTGTCELGQRVLEKRSRFLWCWVRCLNDVTQKCDLISVYFRSSLFYFHLSITWVIH